MEPEGILPFDKRPTLVSKLSFINQVHAFPSILILYHICLDVPGSIFPLGFPTIYILQKKITSKNLKILLFLSEQIQLHNKILQI